MRGAQIKQPFQILRLRSSKYAARNPQNDVIDQTRSKPPDPYQIKPSSSQPCSRIITMGRRQRIPSSPIHISKNKPDQPASTPLSESIHLPVQHQLLKATRAKNPGARNLSKPPPNRKLFFGITSMNPYLGRCVWPVNTASAQFHTRHETRIDAPCPLPHIMRDDIAIRGPARRNRATCDRRHPRGT